MEAGKKTILKSYSLHIILLWLQALLITTACSTSPSDPALREAEAIVDMQPRRVIEILDSLRNVSLPTADRALGNFLTVKAADKAYITHTSDSLILAVIDYERSHPRTGRYAEALYYGGRVYSDLGDYPTALSYFHSALNQLDAKSADPALRGHVLSQTGRLLNTLRLYDEAIPYVDKVIEIDSMLGDSVNLFYDRQLLGAIYLRAKKYEDARRCFGSAITVIDNRPDSARIRMYLAETSFREGNINEAVSLISGLPDEVELHPKS